MAKSKRTVRRMQKDINRLERVLRRRRMSEYREVRGVNKQLYNELLGTVKGRRKMLGRSQARTLDHIARLSQNLRQAGRRVEGELGQTEERLGTAGGMMNSMFSASANRRDALSDVMKSDARAGQSYGRGVAKTGLGLMDILKSGVQEAKAGAQYETAQALASRTKEDVAAIAEQQLALDQLTLQHQFAMEEAEQQFQYAKRLEFVRARAAEQAAEGATGSMKPAEAARFLNSAAISVDNLKGQTNPSTGMPYTPAEIVAEIAAQFGVEPGSSDHRALGRLVASLTSDTRPGEPDSIADEVMDIIRTVPGWQKLDGGKRQPIREMVLAQWAVEEATRQRRELEEEGNRFNTPAFSSDPGGAGY